MNPNVYIVCGAPASGKTWVCKQLKDVYEYVPHDRYIGKSLAKALSRAAHPHKPLLTECPFGISGLMEEIRNKGLIPHPVFISEDLKTIENRYFNRGGEKLPKNFASLAETLQRRASEWGAPSGTSSEILEFLKKETSR